MLRELLNKMRERKARMQEIDSEYRAQLTVAQRRKSADEREVEEFLEDKRQEAIHAQAQKIRAMRQRESWEGKNNILKEKNVFLNHRSILTDNLRLNSWAHARSSGGSMFWT